MRPDVVARNSNFIGYANAVPASLPLLDAEVRGDPTIYPPEELRSRPWTRITTGR